MQPLNAKDISSIRDEYDRLSKTIGRFGFVRAAIIGISAFVLASGLSQISSSGVSKIIDDLKENFQITQLSPDFDNTFLTAIYGRSFQLPSPLAEPAAEAAEPAGPTYSSQEKERALQRQNELVTALKAQAQKAFDLSVNAPLLGTKVDIDLTFWGFILPIFAIFSESYLAILRYKRRLIFKIGGLLVRRDPENASTWSLIQFSEMNSRLPPLMRHPAQYRSRGDMDSHVSFGGLFGLLGKGILENLGFCFKNQFAGFLPFYWDLRRRVCSLRKTSAKMANTSLTGIAWAAAFGPCALCLGPVDFQFCQTCSCKAKYRNRKLRDPLHALVDRC